MFEAAQSFTIFAFGAAMILVATGICVSLCRGDIPRPPIN